MKHKTAELEGALLDAAVLLSIHHPIPADWGWPIRPSDAQPSTNWSHGGPLIERERIAIIKFPSGWVAKIMESYEDYIDTTESWERRNIAPTPLIAAMRAFVASKLGEEVEL